MSRPQSLSRSAPRRSAPATSGRSSGARPRAIERHQATLTRLDAVLGDGDHGDNMVIGFHAVIDLLETCPMTRRGRPPRGRRPSPGCGGRWRIGAALRQRLHRSRVRGGRRGRPRRAAPRRDAAGGRGRPRAARPLRGRGQDDPGCAPPRRRGLRPDGGTGRQLADAFAAAAGAARAGMLSTRGLIARRGLALRLGERSVGTLDPGAVSCFLICALAAR